MTLRVQGRVCSCTRRALLLVVRYIVFYVCGGVYLSFNKLKNRSQDGDGQADEFTVFCNADQFVHDQPACHDGAEKKREWCLHMESIRDIAYHTVDAEAHKD